MEGQIKVSHTLNAEVLTEVQRVAKQEKRSRSNMITVLLLEALAARGEVQVPGASCPVPDAKEAVA